jgi:hypothetical protein
VLSVHRCRPPVVSAQLKLGQFRPGFAEDDVQHLDLCTVLQGELVGPALLLVPTIELLREDVGEHAPGGRGCRGGVGHLGEDGDLGLARWADVEAVSGDAADLRKSEAVGDRQAGLPDVVVVGDDFHAGSK